MRVVGGVARGRRLFGPPGSKARPTADRVREAIFNVLYSLGGVEGGRVLDLFAGTGALAIEALSRGAAEAVLVERDPALVDVIRRNLAATGLEGATVVRDDALRWLETMATAPGVEPFDVAFVDPPYAFDGWAALLARLPARLVVIESDRAIELPPEWAEVRRRTYGGTVVSFARPAASTPTGPSGSDHP